MKRKVKLDAPEPKTDLDLAERNIKRMYNILADCKNATTYVHLEKIERLIQETKGELAKGG